MTEYKKTTAGKRTSDNDGPIPIITSQSKAYRPRIQEFVVGAFLSTERADIRGQRPTAGRNSRACFPWMNCRFWGFEERRF